MMDLTLLSSSCHGPSTTSAKLASAPNSAGGNTPGGSKRIPASLMKMRRESLASTGKYKLPIMPAGAIPNDSLMGMAQIGKEKATANGTSASPTSVSALVTPRRNTSAPKSIQETLSKAMGQIKKPDFDYLNDELDEGSDTESPSPVTTPKPSKNLRRSLSTDDSATIDALARNALATPRRIGRRSNHRQRVSRSSSSDQATTEAVESATANAPPTAPRRSRRPSASLRRSSIQSSTASKPARPVVAQPTKESDDSSESDKSFCNSSSHTPKNKRGVQRWECTGCHYANKCKFKFCGMCGVPKEAAAKLNVPVIEIPTEGQEDSNDFSATSFE